MQSVFTSVETLTPWQCDEVGATVHLLKNFWSQVNPPSDFYTLGAASYIEFCGREDAQVEYYDKARRYNPLLKEYFSGLLENVHWNAKSPKSFCKLRCQSFLPEKLKAARSPLP